MNLLNSKFWLSIANCKFYAWVRVAGFTTALIVAIVLGALPFIKTNISTTYIACYDHYFRIVLLVLIVLMILLCTKIVGGFSVDTFLTALFQYHFIIIAIYFECSY
jgi:putative membrane protein